jgi:hypothetical protein
MVDIVLRNTGETIGTTTLDFMNRQTEVHRSAEAAIAAQRVVDAMDYLIKADALRTERAEFKAEVEAREQADQIRQFVDGVDKIRRRMDSFEAAEQRRIQDALDSAPDPDHPQGLSKIEQDQLPLSPLPPPHGDNQEAEVAIERGRGDQLPSGGSPAVIGRDPEPRQPTEPMGALADAAEPTFAERHGFLRRKDARAHLVRQRRARGGW